MNLLASELLGRIEKREAVVGVIGLGYVGLPLVRAFIRAGYRVVGFDVDQKKVVKLLKGESYIRHIESPWIRECIDSGKFSPTSDVRRLAEPDAILICVPTPLNESRDPDLQYVESTAKQIGAVIRRGQLVILESTTYPGTTREYLLPALEASGLKLGEDFFLAYSPEREDPGNEKFSAVNIPKVVGGMTESSRTIASALYRSALSQTVEVSSCEVAEACKILENTYRSVNIAMVNELKVLFSQMNLDIWEVIAAAKTKPFGFQAFYPGPGLGGHCIPVDPFYLSWLARRHGMSARFIELAGDINREMPNYVIERVIRALNDERRSVRGSRVCILGVAYKQDVDDPRESPSFRLMELLSELGAEISYNDPYIPNLPAMRSFDVPALSSQELTAEFLSQQDCVIVSTAHSKYDWSIVAEHSKLIIDTRNALSSVSKPKARVVKA